MSSSFKGYLFSIIASVCYGLNPLFSLPLYDDGFSPQTVLFYRYGFAVVMLAILMIIQHQSFRLSKNETWLCVLMGIFVSISSLMLFWSFKFIDAGIASTILFTYPLFVAIFMCCFYNERLHLSTWIAIGLSLLGIVLLYRTDNDSTLNLIGILLVIGSSITYAFYLIGINRSVLATMNSLKLSFYATLVGAIIYLGIIGINTDFQPIDNFSQFANAFGLAFFPTVVSLALITQGIHLIGSTSAAIIGALEPLTALFVSIIVFGGTLTLLNILGIILILIAVFWVVLGDKKA